MCPETSISEIVRHSVIITSFVFGMMTLVDYINVVTGGRLGAVLGRGLMRQYVGASFLGATPGCLGAFAVVSLYAHRLLSFGALVACMLATSGDESFVMLAMFPGRALILFALLFVLGIVCGWVSDRVASMTGFVPCEGCRLLEFHEEHCCRISLSGIARNLRRPSLQRFCILVIIGIFLYIVLAGGLGHEEGLWITVTLVGVLGAAAFIVATVPDHYLEEHLWRHLAKEHLWKIFLWVLGTMLVIHYLCSRWDVEKFVSGRLALLMPVAVLLGFIPESGPHLIFTIMYARGLVPFSILLASSMAQDGHGMLPLLSVSVRDFVRVKVFKIVAAFVVGYLALWAGY